MRARAWTDLAAADDDVQALVAACMPLYVQIGLGRPARELGLLLNMMAVRWDMWCGRWVTCAKAQWI